MKHSFQRHEGEPGTKTILLPWSKHAQVLIAAGFSYIGVGFTYVTSEPSHAREVALQYALKWFPLQFWGAIFILVGILAIISSRWPPVTKKWGYVLLTGLSAGWAATYAAGVIAGGAPPGNLSGFFSWGNFAFMWWVISSLSEQPKELVLSDSKEHDGFQ